MALKTVTFYYTGKVQTIQLPDGLREVYLEAAGSIGNKNGGVGGYGGKAYGTYKFNNGDSRILNIYVGGIGWNSGNSYGGGASDIRLNGTDLTNRIIVAGGGGTQTSGGFAGANYGYGIGYAGGFGYGGRDTWSGGGGGWYGGGSGGGKYCDDGGGGGGSSYISLLENAGTSTGVNGTTGYVKITYEEFPFLFCLKKDNDYFIPQSNFYDATTNSFAPLTINQVVDSIKTNVLSIFELCKLFVKDGITYDPSKIIDYSKYKIVGLSSQEVYKLKLIYNPTYKALLNTNIRVCEQYRQVSQGLPSLFIDITSPDKNKLDYFIDYNRDDQDNLRKSCGILNKEVLQYDFFLSFRFEAADAKLQTITLFGRNNDKYTKIKDYSIDVYDDFISKAYIVFHKDYDEVFVNKVSSESATYTINTLDKF
ncbi:hypothetical protein [Clostridium sp. YIM B02555]|uniref:hypothetical protein n=1 Tax=Clostridium sp. YIM B02555 TaxID=2911968 RepID=UPI001EEEDC04|nr:hypothetical protein [Clostridium sp. YIM B02555]